MERPIALKPLSIRDENSVVHRKKATVDGKSKQVAKKGGVAHESRKALNDITNKSSVHIEASSQKTNSENKKCDIVKDGPLHHHAFEAEALPKKISFAKKKLNIAEEGFLHDHSKCIDAQKAASELNFFDTVFPGHDSTDLIRENTKAGHGDCKRKLEEICTSELSDWLKWSWKSPPSSPVRWDSPLRSPFEPVELMLKEDNSDDV